MAHASVAEIDALNILRASHLAMERAVAGLAADHALIDGNMIPRGLGCAATAIVKGDALCLSIAAASIVAKVTRDRMMALYAADFPGYLGSGVLAPPPGDDEFQIIFRFADSTTLTAWEPSAARRAWPAARRAAIRAWTRCSRLWGMRDAGTDPTRWVPTSSPWPAAEPTCWRCWHEKMQANFCLHFLSHILGILIICIVVVIFMIANF